MKFGKKRVAIAEESSEEEASNIFTSYFETCDSYALHDEVDVFQIEFAFNQKDLIHLLKERGTAISKLNWDDQHKIEDKLKTFFTSEVD